MHEADPHPPHHHLCRALADFGEPAFASLVDTTAEMRKVSGDSEVDKLREEGQVTARRQEFEVAETDERGGDPTHHRTGLELRVAVVEHVSKHRLARGHDRKRTGGRDAQVVHGLAAQKLANGRSKHSPSIGSAGVRGGAGSLQLQLPPLPPGVYHLAQGDSASVAELSGPPAELVTAVTRGVGLHASEQRVAAEYRFELRREHIVRGESDEFRHLRRVAEEFGRNHRRRVHAAPACAKHLAPLERCERIAGKLAHEAIVECERPGDSEWVYRFDRAPIHSDRRHVLSEGARQKVREGPTGARPRCERYIARRWWQGSYASLLR